jgi:hypothetical protein
MKIRGIPRAKRVMQVSFLLGVLAGAWGCGGETAPASPGLTGDSKASEEKERSARQAAYGSKGQIGKEAPKQ